MMTAEENEILVAISKIKYPPNLPEDYIVNDYAGGNFDDAHDIGYDRGYADGRAELASKIVKIFRNHGHEVEPIGREVEDDEGEDE